MSSQQISVQAAIAEVSGAEFGDARITKRLEAIAARAAEGPGLSFPRMVATTAEKEAVYRFMGNERVEWTKILAPHVASTASRTVGQDVIRVAHDTTSLRFSTERQDLGYVMNGARGFHTHVALAVSGGEERAPLGVVAMKPFTRAEKGTKGDGSAKAKARTEKLRSEKESSRWEEVAFAAHEALGASAPRAVHVMDREANDYAGMALLSDRGLRFVIRGCARRKLKPTVSVQSILSAGEGQIFRDVRLSRKNTDRPNRIHLNRDERVAKLRIRYHTVELPRPQLEKTGPERLTVNVVQVFEVDTPEKMEPVCWTLFTNEPIGSLAEATAVVDHYRARWRIEEFFKALKTGCQIEKRQLETYSGLLNALAVFIPIAWRLLTLRTLAHLDAPPPATTIFTESQVFLLRELVRTRCKKILAPNPTVKDAMYGIAGLGGHTRWKIPPGWQVLGRGFEDFVKAEAVWGLAMETKRCDQS